MVQGWSLGDARVLRIEEMTGPMFDPPSFFPDFDARVFAVLAERLGAVHVHASGRINASFHSWLLRLPGCTVLVDGCIGNHKDRAPFHRWHDLDTAWPRRLAAAGVAVEDVDVVMCTHLHVDHVGWNTQRSGGRWRPTFPNARYLFARREVDFFRARRGESKSADFDAVSDKVWDDSVLPILEAGQADLLDGEHEVLPDRLRVEATPGHTPGSMSLVLADGAADAALFTGDVIHHPLQVYRPDWNSTYCEQPEQARATRRAVLERLADTPALLMPAHFCTPHAARVVRAADGFELDFVAPDHEIEENASS